MAQVKIPVWEPRFVELTKVDPVLQTDQLGNPSLDSNGQPLGYTMVKQTPIYVDVNQIISVSKFFDLVANVYRNYRVIGIGMIAITVTETDATIRALMAARDCDSLCEYTS
tara:strand:+ start:8044 stop:8376 length:333 start_codon:yes stop_codon:yes gene_type:complete